MKVLVVNLMAACVCIFSCNSKSSDSQARTADSLQEGMTMTNVVFLQYVSGSLESCIKADSLDFNLSSDVIKMRNVEMIHNQTIRDMTSVVVNADECRGDVGKGVYFLSGKVSIKMGTSDLAETNFIVINPSQKTLDAPGKVKYVKKGRIFEADAFHVNLSKPEMTFYGGLKSVLDAGR